MKTSRDTPTDRLIRHLADKQSETGSFGGLFQTALILLCLDKIDPGPPIQKITTAGLDFLLKHGSSKSTWNYWPGNSPHQKVPDDWDDTAAALAVISLYARERLGGKEWSQITKNLTASEIEPGGPYSTWIVPEVLKQKWLDVDVAVNANVAYFLSLHDIHLPNLSQLAEKFIEIGKPESKYYFNDLVTFYFISRFYKGPLAKLACQKILKAPQRNIQDTALAITSLINFGSPFAASSKIRSAKTKRLLEKWIDVLIRAAKEPDKFPTIPFYVEEVVSGRPIYGGGESLTAALILEALHKYGEVINFKSKKSKTETNKTVEAIETADIARFFLDSLKDGWAKNATLSKEIIKKLSEANRLGWEAYRIYDDILDNEGRAERLPLANQNLRDLTLIYREIMPRKCFESFNQLMNAMERANLWERQNCYRPDGRFCELPDYKNYRVLADKSLPHALGPISILSLLGFSQQSPEVKGLLSFFRHYIIARQLNDDAHDWLPDLHRGFLNSASVKILNIWQRSQKSQRSKQSVEYASDVGSAEIERSLQSIFWQSVIPKICIDIKRHLDAAERSLEKISVLQNPSYFLSLLQPIAKSAEQALVERSKTLGFLENY